MNSLSVIMSAPLADGKFADRRALRIEAQPRQAGEKPRSADRFPCYDSCAMLREFIGTSYRAACALAVAAAIGAAPLAACGIKGPLKLPPAPAPVAGAPASEQPPASSPQPAEPKP
jgi:predicted small lipoprotein YifL